MFNKITLLLFILLSPYCVKGQIINTLVNDNEIRFYGIDYNLVRILGKNIGEYDDDFWELLLQSNERLLNNRKKYIDKLEGLLSAKFDIIDLISANRRNQELCRDRLLVVGKMLPIRKLDLQKELQKLDLESSSGIGLVIFANTLNKINSDGTYYYVFFNNRDMSILKVFVVSGKGSGFGFVNHWMNSLYNTLDTLNKVLNTITNNNP